MNQKVYQYILVSVLLFNLQFIRSTLQFNDYTILHSFNSKNYEVAGSVDMIDEDTIEDIPKHRLAYTPEQNLLEDQLRSQFDGEYSQQLYSLKLVNQINGQEILSSIPVAQLPILCQGGFLRIFVDNKDNIYAAQLDIQEYFRVNQYSSYPDIDDAVCQTPLGFMSKELVVVTQPINYAPTLDSISTLIKDPTDASDMERERSQDSNQNEKQKKVEPPKTIMEFLQRNWIVVVAGAFMVFNILTKLDAPQEGSAGVRQSQQTASRQRAQ